MAATTILVEAEAFKNTGGWVNDQQFMDEMGSPFLLAHGLGCPVADATTSVTFAETGTYRVWVRTRDWVAPWKTEKTPQAKKAEGTPGKFQVLIDGKALDTVFGTEGAEWHWQDGGEIQIDKTQATVSLHDLTGFEGRCDAILFCQDLKFTPPISLEELTAYRRKLLGTEQIVDAGKYDLVVVGGGIAGICTAVSAARNGVKVAFIQDRPVLGGNNSSEVRVNLGGDIRKPAWRFPRIGVVVRALEQEQRAHYGPDNTAEIYEDEKKEALVRAEDNISLFLGHRGDGVEMDGKRITDVIAQNIVTGERLRFRSRLVADCTGDGCIGYLAGADYDMTRFKHMGRCNLWNVKETEGPVSFPRCPWALDLSKLPFPGRRGDHTRLGGWFWESGFDRDPIREREYIRDWNFRAMYGAWDTVKNVDKSSPNYRLNWAAHISGPRESRRLLGPVILTQGDILAGREYEDACVGTGWAIDLHYPDPRFNKDFAGDAFLSIYQPLHYPTPYFMPYRILYSRNIKNLFMAGWNVSVTHEALGTARLMRTGGLMGEVVGLAATLCIQHAIDPHDVYEYHLEEFNALLTRGVPPGLNN